MATKVRDIAVKTGEYQDRSTGETKGRWKNVGSLMKGDDGGYFIILDRDFNPAGVPNPEHRSNCILSCFAIRDRNDQGGGQGSGYGGQGGQRDDDDIPF